jgi:hypothetical protein
MVHSTFLVVSAQALALHPPHHHYTFPLDGIMVFSFSARRVGQTWSRNELCLHAPFITAY